MQRLYDVAAVLRRWMDSRQSRTRILVGRAAQKQRHAQKQWAKEKTVAVAQRTSGTEALAEVPLVTGGGRETAFEASKWMEG